MAASKTVGRTCSKCGAIFQGNIRDAALPMLCPKCKAPPPDVADSIDPFDAVLDAIVEPAGPVSPPVEALPSPPPVPVVTPPVIAQAPVVVEPPPVPVVVQPPTGGVKCSFCHTSIPLGELDPRCLPEKPACKTCMAEFEPFLGAPPKAVEHPTEPAPPLIEVSGEVVSEGEQVDAQPVSASPMDATDAFRPEEQPFVKAGWLHLTGTAGRIVIRAGDWVALETIEEPGMVRVHMSRDIIFAFDVVGSPERIIQACGVK